MSKIFKTTAMAFAASAALATAAPASAAIFEYKMTNGDVLTIDTEQQTGSWTGEKLNATFTSPDFATFQGGPTPSFAATLTEMDGVRLVNGTEYTDTTVNGSRTHPQMLKSMGDGKFNLWSWWGDPVVAGDYIKKVGHYSVVDVPAPGVIGLLALALGALGFGRRRRRRKLAA